MRSFLAICSFSVVAHAAFDVSGFSSWLDDVLDEVVDAKIKFEGEVPAYVRGTFVQGGPGRFRFPSMNVTHVFDGFAKHCIVEFKRDGTILYTNVFLKSSYYNESIKEGRIAHSLNMGDTMPSSRGKLDLVLGHGDNNFVKPHLIGNTPQFLQDSPLASCATDDFKKFDYNIKPRILLNTPGTVWQDDVDVPAHVCSTATMAHGGLDPKDGTYTAVMSCTSALGSYMNSYHEVFSIHPSNPLKRNSLARVELPNGRPSSYMHAMGFTSNHVVIVAEPMHIDVKKVMNGYPVAECMWLGNGTIFQVVNRHNGTVRNFEHPSFFFGHIFNTWEEDGDIVIDLSYYHADEDMAFLKMFYFDKILNRTFTDTVAGPKLMRFRLTKDGTVQQTNLLPEEGLTIFELPAMDERKLGSKYCLTYPWQGRSNAYDEDKNSTKVGPGGTYGIGKRNLCTGERSGFYVPNEYPAEVKFIPNPEGTEEDDGVLIGIVYNGTSRSSFFQVIDARTMERIAIAPLPVRTHFFFHSSFFPIGTSETTLLV